MSAKKRAWIAASAILALVWIFDLSRAPDRQLTGRGLVAVINLYQATLSKAMPSMGVQCRFQPTCSPYTEEAIRRHGALRGVFLGAGRILRCGPWTENGTVDPPPPAR